MKITLNKEVFKKYPQLKIAFFHLKKFDNKSKLEESRHLLQEAEQLIRLTFNKETIKNHYLISPWAVAQQEFGKEAKHYNTSVERLMKRVLAKKTVATKDVLTNLVRYIALKNIVPLAVDDLAKVEGDLNFSMAKGGEKVSILKNLKKDALYYRDSKKVLGTKLDYWKSSKTALDNSTTTALVHLEALPPITVKKLNEIIRDAKELLCSFCAGTLNVFILDKKKSSAVVKNK